MRKGKRNGRPRAVLLVGALLLNLLASGLNHALLPVTPAAAQSHPQPCAIRFAVIGDYGLAGASARLVANRVKSWEPDFIITTGDNNYERGAASTIDRNVGQYYHDFIFPYMGRYGEAADVNRFFPSLGNHDWSTPGAQPYLDYFSLPGNERYYEFAWGAAHFFAVDSDPHEPDGASSPSVQADWLRERLAAAAEPWKIVYFHHPPYSSGPHGSSVRMRWPFREWGATAVLSGHDHLYERVDIQGFPYFVNGLGGKSIYAFEATAVDGSQVRYNDDYGAMLVNADPNSITFQFITHGGAVIDTYIIRRTNAPATPTDVAVADTTPTSVTLNWAATPCDGEGFRIERSLDGTNFTRLADLGDSARSYTASRLERRTRYYFRVRAYNEAGRSAPSAVVSAKTRKKKRRG